MLLIADTKTSPECDVKVGSSPHNGNNVARPVSSMTIYQIKKEKLNIWKNVIVISVSFMCLFTAYNSVANLQVFFNQAAIIVL